MTDKEKELQDLADEFNRHVEYFKKKAHNKDVDALKEKLGDAFPDIIQNLIGQDITKNAIVSSASNAWNSLMMRDPEKVMDFVSRGLPEFFPNHTPEKWLPFMDLPEGFRHDYYLSDEGGPHTKPFKLMVGAYCYFLYATERLVWAHINPEFSTEETQDMHDFHMGIMALSAASFGNCHFPETILVHKSILNHAVNIIPDNIKVVPKDILPPKDTILVLPEADVEVRDKNNPLLVWAHITRKNSSDFSIANSNMLDHVLINKNDLKNSDLDFVLITFMDSEQRGYSVFLQLEEDGSIELSNYYAFDNTCLAGLGLALREESYEVAKRILHLFQLCHDEPDLYRPSRVANGKVIYGEMEMEKI